MEDLAHIKLTDWLTCKDQLLTYWTEDEITEALINVGYTEKDLTDEVPFVKEPKYLKLYIKIKTPYTFSTTVAHRRSSQYVKTISVTGALYRIKSRYQGLTHGKLIFSLLCKKFPWMESDIFTKNTITEQKFIVNDFTRLVNIPEEFKSLTIKELLKTKGKNLYESKILQSTQSKFKLYSYDYRDDYQFFCDSDFGTIYLKFSDLFTIKDPERIIKQSPVKNPEALRETKEFKFIAENLK